MLNQDLAGLLRHLAQVIDTPTLRGHSRTNPSPFANSLPTRLREALRDGEKTIAELVALSGATREHVERTIRRNPDLRRARRDDLTVVVRPPE